jgi:hypothetical protein
MTERDDAAVYAAANKKPKQMRRASPSPDTRVPDEPWRRGPDGGDGRGGHGVHGVGLVA